jgi:hypothetical protein
VQSFKDSCEAYSCYVRLKGWVFASFNDLCDAFHISLKHCHTKRVCFHTKLSSYYEMFPVILLWLLVFSFYFPD